VVNFLYKTGQLTKLIGGFAVAALALFVEHRVQQLDVSSEVFMWGIFLGLFVTFAAFAFVCLTVRCPKCRSRLVWRAVRTQPFYNWGSELFTCTVCPVCGFDPQ
jgi:hypothetical protein